MPLHHPPPSRGQHTAHLERPFATESKPMEHVPDTQPVTAEPPSLHLALSPETSAHLHAAAAQIGEPAQVFAEALLAEALTDYEATLVGIQRGLEEADLDAFAAQRHALRRRRAPAAA